MIPVTNIISTLNSIITTGGLSSLELAQVFGAVESLEKYGLGTVESVARLPPAGDNTGRFVFILNESRYVYSNGITWDITNIIRKPDQNVYGWGLNTTNGQLGDGTLVNKSSPVSIIGIIIDWTQVSGGYFHSLALRADGTAWSWGSGTAGRLGDGTISARSSPVSVVGGFTDWIQVSAGREHSLALRANGTAWSWGSGTNGRLGNASTAARSSPGSVVGGFTDWIQVSAGDAHSLGLRANGTAWAWGINTSGVLGDGTIISKTSPVSVVGGFTDWVQVSAGRGHSLGLRGNGTAWAWGLNTAGRLGDGTLISKTSPVSVVGGFTDWIQLNTGCMSYHSIGIRANGTAWAWGLNTNGRLGDGTITSRLSPVSVVGGFTDWIQVSPGGSHSLGLRANGTTWSWGFNGSANLGDNTVISKTSPVSVVGGFTDWVQVSAGQSHNLGLRA